MKKEWEGVEGWTLLLVGCVIKTIHPNITRPSRDFLRTLSGKQLAKIRNTADVANNLPLKGRIME